MRFIASAPQYEEHIAPIREAWTWDDGPPALVASTRELRQNPGSIYMDHGCGLQWHGDRTLDLIRDTASHVLAPNRFLADRYAAAGIGSSVVGTPKMDALIGLSHEVEGPVAVSFHWLSLYRSRILEDYAPALQELVVQVPVIGHGHPRARERLERFFTELGVEFVPDFRDVVERASVYVCDHSSTIYEWAALDRPVVLMDYRGQESFISVSSGLRYEFYNDVGRHAQPGTLVDAVLDAKRAPESHGEARREATLALFPWLGTSVARTLEVLCESEARYERTGRDRASCE